jgi:hypothetical protein
MDDLTNAAQPEPPIPPTTPPATPSPYQGVGGWLLLLCIVLTIISPLVTLVSLVSGYNASSQYFHQFPGLVTLNIVDIILSVSLMAFSVYAGVGLWTLRPGAVAMAKRYLWFFLGYHVIVMFLPFMAGLPAAANNVMLAEVAKDMLRGFVYFVVWYAYLNKSERVKATYPA